MTTIHTRQLQQYTQENYNNTHKTTTTIHKIILQQYTKYNYNNTHKTTTTTHTRQLQQYTQDNTHKFKQVAGSSEYWLLASSPASKVKKKKKKKKQCKYNFESNTTLLYKQFKTTQLYVSAYLKPSAGFDSKELNI